MSCGPGAPRDERGGDRQGDELDQIPQYPSSQVCNGGAYHCYALLRTEASARISPYAAPGGFGPADLKSAYKIDTTQSPGATIAVVDAYDYPNAESDLAAYRSQYGLPPCTKANGCFKVVNQTGAASPLPGPAPSGDDWTVEAALDLDLASAACPNCKLILVEAQDDQGDGLFIGNNGAVTAGATVVSNSWGGPEASNASTYEQYFNHPGIGVFVSSGDSGNTGAQSDYPSTSAYVTAVGGTSLVKSSNSRGWTEGAWSSAGSSCSINIAKPSYQTSSTGCAKRAAADVSAVADPNTGLAVYNAANGGWIVVGGTSASSPFVAGVYALYGLNGVGPSYAYGHTANFFDVTTGTNGTCSGALCHAGAGWDGPTGIGSPNGANLGGGSCTPSCNGKTCGDDGCGGSCGTCAAGQTCNAGTCVGGGGTCGHPICSTGAALDGSCDTCAGNICAQDSYCCTTAWDSVCVGEVSSICGQSCGGGSCAHPICSVGAKLKKSCDSCATNICTQDPYCCNTQWDSQCVSEVSSICGESCN